MNNYILKGKKSDDMKKKMICMGIISMFLLMGLTTASAVVMKESAVMKTASDGKTIYVDDGNTQGPWDGTYEHPYKTIQEGVADSEDGDTVFVYDGHYTVYMDYTNFIDTGIKIKKSIVLHGEDKNNTIITASGMYCVAITILADGVQVNGFTIYAKESAIYGSGICVGSNNSIITDNILKNYYHGIYLGIVSSTSNIIRSNIITDSQGHGIFVIGSSNNQILNNTIKNCQQGVAISSYDANGIYVPSDGNVISGNIIKNSLYGNIRLWDSNNNRIVENDFVVKFGNNADNARSADSTGNTWEKNYFSDYTGKDNNGDGFGDTPYIIPGSSNDQDPSPAMTPYSSSVRSRTNTPFLQFLQSHPNIFQILQKLLQRLGLQ